MKNLIKYIKLMRYALQFKMITILAVIFFCIGILFELTDYNMGSFSLSGLYFALTGVYFFQLVFSTTVSKLVQSSPMKKRLQTTAPTIITTLASLISFTVFIALRCARISPEFLEENNTTWANCYSGIIHSAIFIAILIPYCAFSYKSYIFSIIFISVTVIGIIFLGTSNSFFINITENILNGGNNPVILIIISYALIFLGAIICYVLSLLLYKKDISDLAIRYALRQAQSK